MNRRAATWIRGGLIVLVLAALLAFARQVDWPETWRAVRRASLVVLAAAALVNLLSLVIKGARWWIFLRPIGVPSFRLALRATFAGAALNNLLVANAGDAGRVILVARASHVPSEKVLATLALERLFEVACYVLMLALAVSLFRLPPALHAMRPYAFVALAGMIGMLAYLLRHPEETELPPLDPGGMLHRARRYGRGFLSTLTSVSTARRFAASLTLSALVWVLQVATYMLTARSVDFKLSLVGTIAALLAVNIGFAVRATPGNVGVFQMVYAMTATAFGMDRDEAIGVALLIQTQQILPVILVGLLAAPDMFRAQRGAAPRPA